MNGISERADFIEILRQNTAESPLLQCTETRVGKGSVNLPYLRWLPSCEQFRPNFCARRLNQGHGCNAISYDFHCQRLEIADAIVGGDVNSPSFHDNRAVDDREVMLAVEFC